MAEVFLDGELVVFTGSLPATVGDLRGVFEQTVGPQGRLLAGFAIDGVEFEEHHATQALTEFARIDAWSMTVAEALAQIAGVALAAGAESRAAATELMPTVLRLPWHEAQPRCVELTSILSRMLESAISIAAQLGEKSVVTTAVQHMSVVLETWVNAVQSGDAATVCLRTEDQLLPAIAQVEAALAASSP